MICNLKDLNTFLKRPDHSGLFIYAKEKYKGKCYSTIVVNKKNGGIRILQSPNEKLKRLQRSLLHFFEFGQISNHAKAYIKGIPILENATPHVNADMIVKLDLENFYGTITFGNVYHAIDKALARCPQIGALTGKNGNTSYNSQLSYYMAHICTLEGSLPQGAPTSPMLSNLVFEPLDRIISSYCEKREIAYTRYSDDLTFSGTFGPYGLIGFVEALLLENGYSLNGEKTVIAGTGSRQTVTGIVVNQRPQTARNYRKGIRQELYYIGRYGILEHMEIKYCELSFQERQERAFFEIENLMGRVNYVLQIDRENKEFLRYREECLLLKRTLQEL